MITIPSKKLVAQRNGDLPWAPVLYRKPSGSTTKTPVDLTGWSGRLQFRTAPGAVGDPLLDLSTASQPTASGSALTFPTPKANGVISLFVAKGDWALFTSDAPLTQPSTYSWDLLLTDPVGVTQAYCKGTLVLDVGVTHS